MRYLQHISLMRIVFCDVSDFEKPYIDAAFSAGDTICYKEHFTEEIAKKHPDAEVLSVFVYSQVKEAHMAMMPHLQQIATRSTGYDHIDVEAAKQRGIEVSNVPLYGENTVAEHTFALILSLSRKIHTSYVRSQQADHTIEGLMGFDLKGKRLGVIGAGKIGQHVMRMGRAFSMDVVAFDMQQDEFLADILDFHYVDLEELLQTSDIVSLHVPYNAHTHHLLNRESIGKMKKGSILINTARGGVVDTAALLRALEDGVLAGAGLDVLEGENLLLDEEHVAGKVISSHEKMLQQQHAKLLKMENVVYTPHIGFYSKEALERIITKTIENIATHEGE